MANIFISYSENDERIAREVILGLEGAGYTTWHYGRDNIPGSDYLIQISDAITEAKIFLLVISPQSIESHHVNAEVMCAYEENKSFFPLLHNITLKEFQSKKPSWKFALGTSQAVGLPLLQDIRPAISLVLQGIEKLNVIDKSESYSSATNINIAHPPKGKEGENHAVIQLRFLENFSDFSAKSSKDQISVWIVLWVLWIIGNFIAFSTIGEGFGVLYSNISPFWIVALSYLVTRFLPASPTVNAFLGASANLIFSAWLGWQIGSESGLIFGVIFGGLCGLLVSAALAKKSARVNLLFAGFISLIFVVSMSVFLYESWFFDSHFQMDLFFVNEGLTGSVFALFTGGLMIWCVDFYSKRRG